MGDTGKIKLLKLAFVGLVVGVVSLSISINLLAFSELKDDPKAFDDMMKRPAIPWSIKTPSTPDSKKPPSTPDSHGLYVWNDEDPEDYKHLPLRSYEEHSEELQERVIYNAVPKCGSRTTMTVIRRLSSKNKFNVVTSTVYTKLRLNGTLQKRMVDTLDKVRTPFFFCRHLHFIDFTSYGSNQALYFNLIRDPLSRIVSGYYYRRFGDKSTVQKNFNRSDEEKYQTFDNCVLQRNPECVGHSAYGVGVIPFFCGHDERCKEPSEWALEKAIRNVEEHYLFVGLLEEYEDSLAILEKLFPSMFRNALDTYITTVKTEVSGKFSAFHKSKPSSEVEAIMKKEMKYEYQFYNYIRDKFDETRIRLGITEEDQMSSTG